MKSNNIEKDFIKKEIKELIDQATILDHRKTSEEIAEYLANSNLILLEKMVKSTNIQRSVIIPKEIAEKIKQEAEENYTTFNNVVKKILIDYYKNK